MNWHEDQQTPEYMNNMHYRQERQAQADHARLAQLARENQTPIRPMRAVLAGLGKQMVALGTRLQTLSDEAGGTSQQLRPEW